MREPRDYNMPLHTKRMAKRKRRREKENELRWKRKTESA